MSKLFKPMEVTVDYARVSTEEQKDNQTIDQQTKKLNLWAQCQDTSLEFADHYHDDGVTGRIGLEEREAGRRLLADARRGRFNRVVLTKLDRLGRSARLILNALHELEGLGVAVVSLSESFDSSVPSGRFMRTVIAAMAELDRDNIVERTSEGRRDSQEKGASIATLATYGYMHIGEKEQRRLTPNHAPIPGHAMSEVDVIRWIYRHVIVEGGSCISAARWLNEQRVPTRSAMVGRAGKKGGTPIWAPSTIATILHNPIYKGHERFGHRSRSQQAIVVRDFNADVALVSYEEWDLAQSALEQNLKFSPRNGHREYLLSGLLHCEHCGRKYQGRPSTNPKGVLYLHYACATRMEKRNFGQERMTCHGKTLSVPEIDAAIWEYVCFCFEHPEETVRMVLEERSKVGLRVENDAKEKAKLAARLGELDDQETWLITLGRQRKSIIAKINDQLGEIERERQLLQDQVAIIDGRTAALDRWAQEVAVIEDVLARGRAAIADPNLSFERRQRLIRHFVKRIDVETTGTGRSAEARLRAVLRFHQPGVSVLGEEFEVTNNRLHFDGCNQQHVPTLTAWLKLAA